MGTILGGQSGENISLEQVSVLARRVCWPGERVGGIRARDNYRGGEFMTTYMHVLIGHFIFHPPPPPPPPTHFTHLHKPMHPYMYLHTMQTNSSSREVIKAALVRPSCPTPPPLTLLLPLLHQAAATWEDGPGRSGYDHLTSKITQSVGEVLLILRGSQETSSTTRACDTSPSECVRKCGRREQPLTMRYVEEGCGCSLSTYIAGVIAC